MGSIQRKNGRYRKKVSSRNRKLNFLIFLGITITLAILFSAGSLFRFLLGFGLEVVVFIGVWQAINRGKPKSRQINKRTFSSNAMEPVRFLQTKSNTASSFSKPGTKKFNWVLEDGTGENTAKKAVEKLSEAPKRDIRAEVENWSRMVHYSGSVFDNIKQKTYQQEKTEAKIEEQNNEEDEVVLVQLGDNAFSKMSNQDLALPDDSDLVDEMDELESNCLNTYEEIQNVIEIPSEACLIDSQISGKSRKLVARGNYNGNVRLFRKMEETVACDEPVYREEGIAENVGKIRLTPPIDLLFKSETAVDTKSTGYQPADNAVKLIETLASFGVGAKIINISEGPAVTRYEIQPDYGVKVSKIVNLTDDIALNLAATGVRIEAPIPGKAAIGIEVPNREVTPVFLRDVIGSEKFMDHPSKLAFAVGKDISGEVVIADIARMPHLLIAGATGSGKSVCINTLISSILYKASPDEVKLLMVDPKVVELSIYNGIPHLLVPVVTDPKKAAGALNWAVIEMTSRYKLFADNNVRDLQGYNFLVTEKGVGQKLPQIVIIVDELADLMMAAPNDVEDCICRLAQMARAAGMHLVIATQRPSVDVITGVIKANIPSRISFAVSSQIDSRTILDMAGAEKLLGRGDMLYSPLGMSKPVRVQGGLITDKEVEAIVSYLKSVETTQYDEDILERIENPAEPGQCGPDDVDELLPQVVNMVIEQGMASTSLIQRKFKLGYSRAARILDQLELNGIVGPFEGSKPRKILVTKHQWQEMI